MRTAFLAVFISLWLVVAVYVAVMVLVSAFRRGRYEALSSSPDPAATLPLRTPQ